MPVSLLDRDSLKYPDYFWRELEKSNSQKGKEAPVAVILQAISDNQNALNSPATQSRILQIAKTHQIALKSINAGHLLGPKIREIARTTGKNPKLLIINAHGAPNLVELGKRYWYHRLFFKNRHIYYESDIKAQDFSDLARDAQIHLPCCETGKSLAQRIANIANRTVFAPIEDLSTEYTCLLEEPNNKFRMLSYDDRGLQHIYEFNPNKKPKAFPDTFDLAKKRSAFATLVNYVKDHVSKGDRECQFTMGTLCEDRIIDSEKGSAHWYRLAADEGHQTAQFNLGLCYLNGQGGVDKSEKEAVKWLCLAANQGHLGAQNNLGMFYQEGLGGLKKSDKDALKWFRLAADQGQPNAQYNLGLAYAEGRGGLSQSKEMAKKWFRLAADQGHAEAKKRCINS